MLLTLDKDGFVNVCAICGSRSTYVFNYGSAKGKPGPFVLTPGMSVTFRFDDDNGGPGTIEVVTFNAGDFPDFNNVTTDQMITKLNSSLQGGTASDDFGGVLVLSKTSGPTSCVETIDGDARKPLGFMLYDDTGVHTCCGRPCLGFVNNENPRERPGHRSIMLRRCWCGNQEMLISSQESFADRQDHTDYRHSHRMGVNRLAKVLNDNGHHDVDSCAFYQAKDRFTGADIHPQCPVANGPLQLISYDDLKKVMGPHWDYVQQNGKLPQGEE